MKKLLIIVIVLVVAILAYAAFLPKDFKIEQSITVNKPVTEVYNYLRFLSKAGEWNPWDGRDPNISKTFKGTDGEVGSIVSWSGNKEVGSGEEEITNLVPDKRIDFELRFKEPMATTNVGYFELESFSENQTQVTWVMSGKTKFPFNILCFFMKDTVEKDFLEGLENIKRNLEK